MPIIAIIVLFEFVSTQKPTLFYSAFTSNNFQSSEGWIITGNSNNAIYSDCDHRRIIGGYNRFGSNAKAQLQLSLPAHYLIKLSLQFWKIDSWDYEFLNIYLDGKKIYTQQIGFVGEDLCGARNLRPAWGEKIIQIEQILFHSNDNMKIEITTSLNQGSDDESWGFRDFYILLYQKPDLILKYQTKDPQTTSDFLEQIHTIWFDGWFMQNAPRELRYLPESQYYLYKTNQNFIDILHDQIKLIQNIQVIHNFNYLFDYNMSPLVGVCDLQFVLQFETNRINQILIGQYLSSCSVNCVKDMVILFGNTCGDNIVQSPEQCDDGNIYPFDGCFNCQFECDINCFICVQGVCFRFMIVQNHYYQDISEIDYQQYDNFQFQCNQNCVYCQYGLCLACQLGYILYNNQCFIICNHLNYKYDEYCILQSYLPHQFEIQQYLEFQEGCLQQLNGYCILCQQGWIIDLHTQKCKIICGDLNINGNEECDILFKLPQLYDYGCFECNYKCQNVCDQCSYGKCYKCRQGWMLQNFKCLSVCGDGILVEGEICDDGNDIQHDGCYNCQYECHHQCKTCSQGQCYECNDGYSFVDNTCVTRCGDGVLDIKREKCDDMNQLPNDGCYKCQIQDRFYCYHEKLKFQYCQRCFDINCLNCQINKENNTQQCILCQSGYFIDSYYQCSKCDQICKQCFKSFKNCTEYNFDYYQAKQCDNKLGYYYDFQKRDCISKCGDGIISDKEQCDDSNIENYDGCNQFCQIEKGYLMYKNNLTLIKEPKLEVQIQQNKSIQFQITSNFSFQVLNCSSAQLNIQKFSVSFYNYKIFDSNNSCDFIINVNKTIEPYNLIEVTIKYYNQYQKTRLLKENVQEIIITPNRYIYVSEEQKQQGEATAAASQSLISAIFFAAPIALVFGGFRFIWPIIDILNWINNFYFINVNYPENVRLLLKQFEWASFLDIPQINLLNQEGCDYYFKPKEKFYEKGMDPLYFNGIQKITSLLLQVVGIKLLCLIFRNLINKIYKIRQQSDNVKKASIFHMKNLSQIRTQIDKKQHIDEPNYIIKIPPILKNLYYRCLSFEFYFIANIIKTLQISFLDLLFAILLQLSNQQTSNHLIVQINIFISYFSILIVFYLLNKSYQISQLHVQQLNSNQYKKHFSCFYEGMKLDSKLAMSYSFLNLVRKLIFTISTVLLYDNPIYQTTICFSACFFNIIIYFIINPFENKELYIQNFISDFCILIIIGITIIFSVQDKFGKFKDEIIYQLGWVIIGCLSLAIISQLAFLIKEMILEAYQKIKKLINYCKEKCK